MMLETFIRGCLGALGVFIVIYLVQLAWKIAAGALQKVPSLSAKAIDKTAHMAGTFAGKAAEFGDNVAVAYRNARDQAAGNSSTDSEGRSFQKAQDEDIGNEIPVKREDRCQPTPEASSEGLAQSGAAGTKTAEFALQYLGRPIRIEQYMSKYGKRKADILSYIETGKIRSCEVDGVVWVSDFPT